jgi:hypothetical protein
MRALALGLLCVLVVGCASPAPSSSGSKGATATATAPGATHMSRWGLAFDYPANWTVADENENLHYDTILGYVGSGSFSEPCTAITAPPGQSFPVGEECSPVWSVPPGTAVIRFESFSGPIPVSPIVNNTDPSLRPTVIGGLPALGPVDTTLPSAATGTATLDWMLSTPGEPITVYALEAEMQGPDLRTLQQQVLAVVASITYDPPVVPLPTGDALAPAEAALLGKAIPDLIAHDNSLACFPAAPGATDTATITRTSVGPLRKPLPVRCTTDIQPTPLGLWHLTLTYRWDAAADRTAGSASLETNLLPDGTRVGGFVGPSGVAYGP